jgi:1,4-dihydroxy-2-naphthoate octaprenyltransferase
LGRPLFLVGGFILHGLGMAMALYEGAELDMAALLWGQLAVTAIQLMTHYSNDYFDIAADRANQTPTRWSGGSRVLVEGQLGPGVALGAALFLAAVALLATGVLGLAVRPGPLAIPLLLLALALAWGYSAPPLRLHSRGLGELSVAALVPGLTPLLGYYLQSGRLAWLPVLAALPLCCFQFAMLLVIELPDANGDAAAGKATLVVRFGARWAAGLYKLALAAAYTSLPFLVAAGLPAPVGAALLLAGPVAAWQGWRFHRGLWARPESWASLAFWSIGLLMGSAAAELAMFLILVLTAA